MATPVGKSHPESNEAFAARRGGWRVRQAFPDPGTAIVSCCLFSPQKHRIQLSGILLSLFENGIRAH